jgi:hypothetical protein
MRRRSIFDEIEDKQHISSVNIHHLGLGIFLRHSICLSAIQLLRSIVNEIIGIQIKIAGVTKIPKQQLSPRRYMRLVIITPFVLISVPAKQHSAIIPVRTLLVVEIRINIAPSIYFVLPEITNISKESINKVNGIFTNAYQTEIPHHRHSNEIPWT